jgi:hypothetical protein
MYLPYKEQKHSKPTLNQTIRYFSAIILAIHHKVPPLQLSDKQGWFQAVSKENS